MLEENEQVGPVLCWFEHLLVFFSFILIDIDFLFAPETTPNHSRLSLFLFLPLAVEMLYFNFIAILFINLILAIPNYNFY